MNNEIKITFLGQCGFLISYKDKNILIDAVLNDLLDKEGKTRRLYPHPFKASDIKVDYMLFTHVHRDHFAYESACDAHKGNKDIVYIMPKGFIDKLDELNLSDKNICGLSGYDKTNIEEIEIESFPTFHPIKDEENNLGYLIKINGKKIVHLGDTYLNDELFNTLKNIEDIDVLMAPTNGRDYFRESRNIIGNMEMEEATLLAYNLNVKNFIPTHYDMMSGNTADINRAINKAKELDYKNLRALKLLENIEI